MALEKAKASVCYNGDLFTAELYEDFCKRFPQMDKGHDGKRASEKSGPWYRRSKGKGSWIKKNFWLFMTLYARNMKKFMSGDKNVLFKMKELWFYMGSLFGEDKKAMKKIKKAQRLPEYQAAVREMSALWQKNEFAGEKLK